MSEGFAIGIDWSNGGWLAVILEDQELGEVIVEPEITGITEEYAADASRILIDIPIGLFEAGERDEDQELVRKCDSLARKVLGTRHSSVFNPPAREVTEMIHGEKSHAAASERNREITGKGLQLQAYHIGDAIYEVDSLLEKTDENNDFVNNISESHPEVCFRALAEDEIAYSKSTIQGAVERLEVLAEHGMDAWEIFQEISKCIIDETERDIDVDDVIDAMVLAYVAAAPDEEIYWLPPRFDHGETAEQNRDSVMEMAYRAEEPLQASKNIFDI